MAVTYEVVFRLLFLALALVGLGLGYYGLTALGIAAFFLIKIYTRHRSK